jgi:hypothetical protein
MEIGFIDFIVINFNEVGSHRDIIFQIIVRSFSLRMALYGPKHVIY